jgi:hypothetical protein
MLEREETSRPPLYVSVYARQIHSIDEPGDKKHGE